jgi:Mn-dependent DtxR family transcriptional regulator
MTQEEIIQILKENDELNIKQISAALNISKPSVGSCLRKLLKYNEVKYIVRPTGKFGCSKVKWWSLK